MAGGDALGAGDVAEIGETVGLADVDGEGLVDIRTGEGDGMPFTAETSVFLLEGKTGTNANAHTRKKTGPKIFSHLLASCENIGILNSPKSAPEKYGANSRIKEKLSKTTPNESGSPDSL